MWRCLPNVVTETTIKWIRLPRTLRNDIAVWTWSKYGVYTVRVGYTRGKSNNSLLHERPSSSKMWITSYGRRFGDSKYYQRSSFSCRKWWNQLFSHSWIADFFHLTLLLNLFIFFIYFILSFIHQLFFTLIFHMIKRIHD